jgi:RimJ/RimL family protein N-acetyltransferase
MNSYSCLKTQTFKIGEFSIVPIRLEDRFDIMKWRNEQIYHLRQSKPLTEEDQELYFQNVVSNLFDHSKPDQLLFSFLKNDICVGYGGLVHINWVDKHAEISFIMDTQDEKDHFDDYWSKYLGMIENVGFIEMGFHKLFVFAFDLRPHLYDVLKKNNYFLDARLKEHCLFNGEFIDVVIHSKIK